MMLVFYDAGLTLTWQLPLDDAQQKQNFKKDEDWIECWKEAFWYEKPVAFIGQRQMLKPILKLRVWAMVVLTF